MIPTRKQADLALRTLAERKGFFIETAIAPDHWRLKDPNNKRVVNGNTAAFSYYKAWQYLDKQPDKQ